MPTADLHTAIVEILQACRPGKRHGGKNHPYFFVVGAGVSYPSVPLAAEIITKCQAKVRKDFRASSIRKPGPGPMAQYSYWMSTAFPHAKMRQEYIEGLIRNKPLSLANLRLAHILSSGKLARLVVTPNFDDHLSRALRLFGIDSVICDHPAVTARVSLERDSPITIVHVHGTHWFYDCRNLDGEIRERAAPPMPGRDPAPAASPMAEILGQMLQESSPLVVGYSGWEEDVIMRALKQKLIGNTMLPYNLYWFCYSSSDAESLPAWLKTHQSVVIVAPHNPLATGLSARSGDGAKFTGSEQISRTQEPEVIPAQMVFDEIIRQFELPTPLLITDPLESFISAFNAAINVDSESENEIYKFKDVEAQILRAKELLNDDTSVPAKTKLDEAADYVQQARYAEALKLLRDVATDQISEPVADRVLGWLKLSLGSLPDSNQAIEACDSAIAVSDILSRSELRPEQKREAKVLCARALLRKSDALDTLGKHSEELEQYDQITRRFGDATEPELRELVARSLIGKGVALSQAGKAEDAIATFRGVVGRFGGAEGPALPEQVALALFNAGVALMQAGKLGEAIAAYNEAVVRLGGAKKSALRGLVAKALVNKGVALRRAGRPEEAVAAHGEAISRFGDATEPGLREQVAMAMTNKGITLWEAEKSDEAIAAFREVVSRFGDATEPALREWAAKALVNKGITLGQIGKPDGAVAVYDEVIRRFGDATEPGLREQVAMALVNKGVALRRAGRPEEAVAAYEEVISRFGDATEPGLREQVAKARRGKGQILGGTDAPE